MLSINFAQVAPNVEVGDASLEDHRNLRIWAGISLNHLQYVNKEITSPRSCQSVKQLLIYPLTCVHMYRWAVATGRSSFIPQHYVNNCLMILDIYQATIEDAMVVAEIMLYSCINSIGEQQARLSADGNFAEMTAWKHKWKHLFSTYNTSYGLRLILHA